MFPLVLDECSYLENVLKGIFKRFLFSNEISKGYLYNIKEHLVSDIEIGNESCL